MKWLDAWRKDCKDSFKFYRDYEPLPEPEIQIDWSPLLPSLVGKVELSHTEWADGYKRWKADRTYADLYGPCFADNEV
jgi:hypothetical protein